ncbi:MAG: PEP-CTERM sorting domain-containing protein [Akkermansia sp.]
MSSAIDYEITDADFGDREVYEMFVGTSSYNTLVKENLFTLPEENDTVIINTVGDGMYLPGRSYVCNAGTIEIINMKIVNGSTFSTYTFNSSIVGEGDIEFHSWYYSGSVSADEYTRLPTNCQLYQFTGDMSGWSGNLTTTTADDEDFINSPGEYVYDDDGNLVGKQADYADVMPDGYTSSSICGARTTGGLSLNIGSIRDDDGNITYLVESSDVAASGTGSIDLQNDRCYITYDYSESACIANTSISAATINLKGGADYTIISDVTATLLLSIDHDTSVTMCSESSSQITALELAEGASLTLSSGSSFYISDVITVSGEEQITLESGSLFSFSDDIVFDLSSVDFTNLGDDYYTFQLMSTESTADITSLFTGLDQDNVSGIGNASSITFGTDGSISFFATDLGTDDTVDVGGAVIVSGSDAVYIVNEDASNMETSSRSVYTDNYAWYGCNSNQDVVAIIEEDGTLIFNEASSIKGGIALESGTLVFNSSEDGESTYNIEGGIYLKRSNADNVYDPVTNHNNTIIVGANTQVNISANSVYDNSTLCDLTVQLGANSELNQNVNLWIGNGTTLITGAEGVTNENAGKYTISSLLLNFTGFGGGDVSLIVAEGAIFEVLGKETGNSYIGDDSFVLGAMSRHEVDVTVDGKLVVNSGVSSSSGASINVNDGGTIQMNAGAYASGSGLVELNLNSGSSLILGNQNDHDSGKLSVAISGEVSIQSNGASDEVNVNTEFEFSENASIQLVSSEASSLKFNSSIEGSNLSVTIGNDSVVELNGGAQIETLLMCDGADLIITSDVNINNLSSDTEQAVITIGDGGYLSVNLAESYSGDILIAGGTLDLASTTEIILASDTSTTGITVTSGVIATSSSLQLSAGITNVATGATLEIKAELNLADNIQASFGSIGASLILQKDVTLGANSVLTLNGNVSGSANFIGTGTATINYTGVFSPGNSPELIRYDDLTVTYLEGSTLVMEIFGEAGAGVEGGHDKIVFSGCGVSFDGTIQLSIDDVAALVGGDEDVVLTFDLFDFDGSASVLTEGEFVLVYNSSDWKITANTDSLYTTGEVSLSFVSVPEPSTATLSLLALAGMLARRRRKAA